MKQKPYINVAQRWVNFYVAVFISLSIIGCNHKSKLNGISSLHIKHEAYDRGMGYVFVYNGFMDKTDDVKKILNFAHRSHLDSIRSMTFVLSDAGFNDDIDEINESEKQFICTIHWDTLGRKKNKFVYFESSKDYLNNNLDDIGFKELIQPKVPDVYKFSFYEERSLSLGLINTVLIFINDEYIDAKKNNLKAFQKEQRFRFHNPNGKLVLEIVYEKNGINFDILSP